MAIRERLSGNEAVAYAIKQINPDVMPAFPITPSTEIPQYVANYIANGEIDTEFIHVESEHSAMSAALGASAAGARTLTATSSCGMALMWEELYVAASDRLPIVLALVNRALTGTMIPTVPELRAGTKIKRISIRTMGATAIFQFLETKATPRPPNSAGRI